MFTVIFFLVDFARLADFCQRELFALAAFVDFEEKQTCDADGIPGIIEDFFAFGDSFGDAVDRFVGVIFGKRAAAPFEEAHEIASDFEILLGGAIAVPAERDEQPVKRFLCECPFLSSSRIHRLHRLHRLQQIS